MLLLVAKLVSSYLLGSVIGSLFVGGLRGGVDIRTVGSGNPGGTNALRTQGRAFAAWVMLIDVGKAVLAVTLVAHSRLPALGGDALAPDPTALACGAAAVVGHVWPVFYGFRGGKGAATLVGTLAAAAPLALVPVLGVFALSLVASGYVGISTILACWSLPLAVALVPAVGVQDPLFLFGVAMAGFISWTHRSNIARMRAGTEHRFERVMLFRRRTGV